MSSSSEEKVCGEGAYGKVVNLGNGQAQKTLNFLPALVQEYAALSYVKGWTGLLQGGEANFGKKTLNMELCDNSLRGHMDSNKDPGKAGKIQLFREILAGLYQLHANGIIHSDLKPGNILVKDGKALLGDLGFVNVHKYARVHNTARNYRDSAKIPDYAHDLYSLGIVLAELVCWRRVDKRKISHELDKAGKEYEAEAALSHKLMGKKRRHRPTVEEIFRDFLKEEPPSILVKDKPAHSIKVDKEVAASIRGYMKKHCQVYRINRGLAGYKALLTFLSKEKYSMHQLYLYVPCTLMILSSIFGKSGYFEDEVFAACSRRGFDYEDIFSALKRLCDSQDFLDVLFMSKA